ncbi:hypothetical protein HK405_010389 [Cladochytrium tenue]|nr:hypothetical protein HK405_010389 [Cladochytrium tenue]
MDGGNNASSTGGDAGALADLRLRIDALDAQLVGLLNERAEVSVSIGAAKRRRLPADPATSPTAPEARAAPDAAHVHVPAREMAVYKKVRGLNKGPLSGECVEAIYREIMSASISLQRDIVIAFLGPKGSYSQTAAYQRFGDSVIYAEQATIRGVFKAVESGAATYGVVPFENSTHGSVSEALDSFLDSTVMVRAEAHYYFFLDISGHQDDAQLQQALLDLQPFCLMTRLLGSFPLAVEP